MSEDTLKFNDVAVSIKQFHASKQKAILNSVLIDKIVVSDKFEHSDKGFKFFIGRGKNDIIRLACIMLPQKSDYVKYFDYGGKNMFFKIEDNNVLVKQNEHWNRIYKMLDRKLHEKQIKAKVKTFNEKVNTVFSDNKIPNGSIHYICIAAISIDSFMKIDKD